MSTHLNAEQVGNLSRLVVSRDLSTSVPNVQLLLTAKARLEGVVEAKFEDAVARRDTAAAVKFAKLYKPLGKQVRAAWGSLPFPPCTHSV